MHKLIIIEQRTYTPCLPRKCGFAMSYGPKTSHEPMIASAFELRNKSYNIHLNNEKFYQMEARLRSTRLKYSDLIVMSLRNRVHLTQCLFGERCLIVITLHHGVVLHHFTSLNKLPCCYSILLNMTIKDVPNQISTFIDM